MPWAWSKKLPGLVSTLATEKHPSGTQPKNFLWTYILWCKAKILYELWLSLFFCKKTWFWPILSNCAENFSEIQNSFFQSKALFLLYNILSEDFQKLKIVCLWLEKPRPLKMRQILLKKFFCPKLSSRWFPSKTHIPQTLWGVGGPDGPHPISQPLGPNSHIWSLFSRHVC